LLADLLQVQSYKRKIKELEDKLLSCLVNSGNLLEDKELIDILAKTKETAQVRSNAADAGPNFIQQACPIVWRACLQNYVAAGCQCGSKSATGIYMYKLSTMQEVTERLMTASETRRKITEACEEYRPVAHRATLLYFLIAEFSPVNSMYQVGAGWNIAHCPGSGLG